MNTRKLPMAALLMLLAALAGCRTDEPDDDAGHADGHGEHHADTDPHDRHADDGVHADDHGDHRDDDHADEHGDHHGADAVVQLTAAQVAAGGIEVQPVQRGPTDAASVPATIAADPERSTVVAAAVGGRVVSLAKNIGEQVQRGDELAVIESRDIAELKAEVEAARQQLALAESTLRREETLFAERVSAEQDVLAARTAAAEARIRVRLAEQRLGATGNRDGGALNRLVVRAPIDGHVIAREAALGEVVAADAELFRIADLSTLSIELALTPALAAQVQRGGEVRLASVGREATGRITLVSPVIDPHTRQVRALALLPNPDGRWRVGEAVQATLPLAGAADAAAIAVPQAAIQTVDDRPSVFVRTDEGFEVRPVVLGPAAGGRVVVTAGLHGDERIAVANSYVLKAELGKGEAGHAH